MSACSIVEGFFHSAESNPDKTAIIWNGESISYAEVRANVLRVAAFLKAKEVKRSDRVAFYAQKNPLFAYTYLAIHLLKAAAVPLDVKLPKERLEEVVKQTEPQVLLHPIEFDQPFEQYPFDEKLLNQPPLDSFDFPSEDDLADIIFTTGTTGNSKGVKLTHKNILAGAVNSNEFIGNGASDIEIIPLPLHHAFGLRRLRTNLYLGATAFLVDGFMYPKLIMEAIDDYKATGICMVPAGFSVIKRLTKDKYIPAFKKLKYIEFGSAPMDMDEKKELVENLPDTKICMHFGLTEVAANIFLDFHRSGKKMNALGKESPNVSVSILDENGIPLPTDEVGEIAVKGDIQTSGYWKNIELTKRSFINGWFKTGDYGFKDEEGYIFLKGRKDDVINIGGKKVFPSEIEAALNLHPSIKDSACVAVQNVAGITGVTIKAFLVLSGGNKPTPKEIIAFLRNKLELYKIPQEIQFVKIIPMTASGKKQRDKLK